MKGILEFELPEEKIDFEIACKADNFKLVISEILNLIRQKTKYENQSLINLAEFRKEIIMFCDENNVTDLL